MVEGLREAELERGRSHQWTYLYSEVVLDLISLYLFFVYIDISFPSLGCF